VARPGPSSRGQLHVWRYLGSLFLIFVVLYTTLAFAGKGSAWLKPKLGLDLQGGAQVILTPKTESGKKPKASELDAAVSILRQRVNGAGVSEADVKTEGDQILVQVPGGNAADINNVTKAAQLQFRRVVEEEPVISTQPQPTPTATPKASASPSVSASPSASPKKRPITSGLTAASASPTPSPSPSSTPSPSPSTADEDLIYSGVEYTAANWAAIDCSNPRVRKGGDAPDQPTKEIIACDRSGSFKFHLAVAKVVGKDIKGAAAGSDQTTGAPEVSLSFKGKGQDAWTNLTKEAFGATAPTNQVAIVLDGVIISAPVIQSVINGDARITGVDQDEARDLANNLKFGALPLSFVSGDKEVISASLGDDQLRSGLIAGGIGLAAVIIYSFLYYRMLGFVTIASLAVSGGLTYAMLCILGKELGLALSLAGIAGFIVAVGITADSFVVYFERLKDEIKEGRTPRSAVDVAWHRAIRTILNADTVSFLAAVLLYFFAVGGVRGFAFTLGLSTVLDLVVVVLFTRPMISLLAKQKWFARSGPTGFYGPDGGQPHTGGPRPSLTSKTEA
jgi:preprotein translocase subunit SecD